MIAPKIQQVLLVFVLASGILFTVAANAADIGTVVQDACRKCHSTKRICLMLGKKSAESWERTVQTMISKGAKVPVERKGEAAEYLADLSPGSEIFCR